VFISMKIFNGYVLSPVCWLANCNAGKCPFLCLKSETGWDLKNLQKTEFLTKIFRNINIGGKCYCFKELENQQHDLCIKDETRFCIYLSMSPSFLFLCRAQLQGMHYSTMWPKHTRRRHMLYLHLKLLYSN
jgi:hypothetical protein